MPCAGVIVYQVEQDLVGGDGNVARIRIDRVDTINGAQEQADRLDRRFREALGLIDTDTPHDDDDTHMTRRWSVGRSKQEMCELQRHGPTHERGRTMFLNCGEKQSKSGGLKLDSRR